MTLGNMWDALKVWLDMTLAFDTNKPVKSYCSVRSPPQEGYAFAYVCPSVFLLRKIALPYPHKCLFGFVEQNTSTDKNF